VKIEKIHLPSWRIHLAF